MLSPRLLGRSKYAEPPHPHQSTTCSYWEFQKRHIDVSDTVRDTVLDAESRVWMLTMHGRIQKILSGGLGVLRSLFQFFLFHRGQCGPDLPFEAIGPTGSYFFPRLSITVYLRKHISNFDLPAGLQTLCPPPLGHATHAMLS